MAVSFDCFGTLVTADRPDQPWDAVAAALRTRGVPVPDDWEAAYRTAHREYDRWAEAPLDDHVRLALASRDVTIDPVTARRATLDAFDGEVSLREGARDAVAAAGTDGPVAVCSNCSVPGLVERTLDRVEVSVDRVVTSVACGRRKPDRAIFAETADALGRPLSELVHVGDEARTDGGAERAGGTTVLVTDVALPDFPDWLDREGSPC